MRNWTGAMEEGKLIVLITFFFYIKSQALVLLSFFFL